MRRSILGHLRRFWGRAPRPDQAGPEPASGDQDGRFQAAMRLCPGHLVTLTQHGPALLLLPEPYQYGQLPALVLLEELSRAESRSVWSIILAAAARSGAAVEHHEQLVAAIDGAGFLTPDTSDATHERIERAPIAAALAAPRDVNLSIAVPRTLVVEDGHFLWFDQTGRLEDRSSAEEVDALRSFFPARTVTEAFDDHAQRAGVRALPREAFDRLADRLYRSGLLVAEDALRSNRADPVPFIFGPAAAAIQTRFVEAIASREPGPPTDRTRVPVIPVNTNANVRPLSLGLLLGHASEFEGGRLRERYDLLPLFFCDAELIAERARTPSIFLFSNYMWNLEENLALSALVKRVNPENVTIHGGPSTPKYEGDAQRYFDEHTHVDVAVRGEGEATFVAILDALDPARPSNLRPLADVTGLTFRLPTGLVRTPDRERVSDLDLIPSPYLLGMFEPFGMEKAGAINLETNRGCPYGCTFCDWGSRRSPAIRKFPIERVKAEMAWGSGPGLEAARSPMRTSAYSRATREIAQYAVELNEQYGYPSAFQVDSREEPRRQPGRDRGRSSRTPEILTRRAWSRCRPSTPACSRRSSGATSNRSATTRSPTSSATPACRCTPTSWSVFRARTCRHGPQRSATVRQPRRDSRA